MIRRLAAAAAAVIAAAPACAHGSFEGGGGFYAGLAHPFLAWEHLMLLAGFGLLLGRGYPPDRTPLAGLALGLAGGLGAALFGFAWSGSPVAVLTAGVIAGIGLATALPLALGVGVAFGAAIGGLIGIDTGVPTAVPGAATWFALGGVFTAVFLIVLNVMALAGLATRPPYTIAVRVAGSWIAAASLMVLALEFRRLGGAI